MRDAVGFMMYRDYFEYFSYLSKEEKADLLDAVFAYVFQGESPASLSPLAGLAFAVVRNNVDRDFEKYDKKCEKNRKNGALGGRPRKEEKEQKEEKAPAEATSEERTSISDSDKTDAQFEEFFEFYPKKTDREEAQAEFSRICPDEGEFFIIMDHLRYCQKSEGWKKEGGRYIPKASAWLSRREWKKPTGTKGSFDTDDFFEAALRR